MKEEFRKIVLISLVITAGIILYFLLISSDDKRPIVANPSEASISASLDIAPVAQSKEATEKITYLIKDAGIEQVSNENENNYAFALISDLCVDAEDNLYVADMRSHRLFKYDNNLRYLCSFGRTGQGPGEFLGRLRINAGNDGKLYISDDIAQKFSVFSRGGQFIHQCRLFANTYDVPVANSKGNIYLLSGSNIKVIDYFVNNRLFQQLIEMEYHQLDYLERPRYYQISAMMRPPNSLEVIKAISINDYPLCLFNHSLSIVILEDNNKVDKRFKIDHPRFLGDYTKRMRKARAQNAGVLPFGSAFFDNSDQICISYYNDSLKIPEIYRYKMNGEFVDTVRLEDVKFVTNRILLACDRRGYFYGVNEEKNEVIRYKYKL